MAIHISLAFMQYNDAPLDEYASNVVIKMGLNVAIFATPTVPLATITTAQVNFHNALAAQTQGATAATLDKEAKRTVLLNLLRTQAIYVQDLPGMTAANAELSGFTTVTLGHHPAVTLVVPVIQGIINAVTTQLGVKLQSVPGATGYDIQLTVGTGAPVLAGHFSSTRNIVLTGQLPGSMCAVQARSCAGNNQVSDWSLPTTIMCT